ncbi:MAG: polysaccharide deacetylase family protein [Hoeflea sp.]|uniref:polysaccharide deacetylase family protein n=1 Tax=Hoeflea sp. TaxID=1940281 RepID=UPI001D6B0D53|nr:polysaccharide deacetylase family protein [Hoeflea sp.]MBU4530977.1 polysaccharide deacetylase family protein [Alphaproteobacteria bacterium]MBU4542752.1 polysaccharide deacetylase family protein [Alphaproteobacteria bacterium]MBU4552564.1 polysaccharide deacetylase family protein [Alphaproteobacteria bacterium]MBV1722869.1 polysaccharide deacetylase family protein [Hoeflea sp.]MBV1762780.1 polysaccharide deacetylase family protein [Hoeflea sp.]
MTSRDGQSRIVYMTVDAEPDCPPFLWTWRGIEEGMPLLFDLFDNEGIKATFFTTGDTAAKHPACVETLVAKGHELGCHGYSHNSFAEMDEETARDEIVRTNEILRKFAPVTSFRAPYLSFPERFVKILAEEGFSLDSSRAAYKLKDPPAEVEGGPVRLEASVTSSVLRIPEIVRTPWFRLLQSPVTLFVHPWEFVDLTATRLRYDCRFRTGQPALDSLRSAIRHFKDRGFEFRLARDHVSGAAPACRTRSR